MITPRVADFLAEWLPFSVEITLYGHTKETYEKVTGIPGSHARCRFGIELLLERGIPIKLKTMVLKLNQHELWDMKTFAENLKLDFRYDGIINPGIEDSKSPLSMRLPPEDFVQLERIDEARSQRLLRMYNERAGIKDESRMLYRCLAGINGFHIDPYGMLSLCMLERKPGYDLRNGSFHDGWNIAIPRLREKQYENGFRCIQCDLRLTCSQCPAMSQLENKDPSVPVEYVCQVTKLRAKTFRDHSFDIKQ
jgi:radical SAM protein with 4Fe4S-binding SPASM domain